MTIKLIFLGTSFSKENIILKLEQSDILRSQVVTEVLNIYQFKKPFDLKSVSKTSPVFYKKSFSNQDKSNLDAAMIPKKLL